MRKYRRIKNPLVLVLVVILSSGCTTIHSLKPDQNVIGKTIYPGDNVKVITRIGKVMEFKVKEAPPAVRGDTSKSGNKTITLENNTTLNAPMFIEEGDVIRVNTETGEYVERV